MPFGPLLESLAKIFRKRAVLPPVEDIDLRHKLTIFWLEDEPRRMAKYFEAVKMELVKIADLELRIFSDVDDAWEFVRGHYSQIDIAILDIMMSVGNFCKDDQDEEVSLGFKTGAVFFERMRQLKKIPTIFFTDVYDLSLQQRLAILGAYSFLQKRTFLPQEFALEVLMLAKTQLEIKLACRQGGACAKCSSHSE